MVTNEKNELILTKTIIGWRVCINYRKLNEATRKDYFSLPFIDQVLERLFEYPYYCFLDGYSGYFYIPIVPDDQEKTTFTCSYGIFSYKRISFRLCNALATFQRCMMAIFLIWLRNSLRSLWIFFLYLIFILMTIYLTYPKF